MITHHDMEAMDDGQTRKDSATYPNIRHERMVPPFIGYPTSCKQVITAMYEYFMPEGQPK